VCKFEDEQQQNRMRNNKLEVLGYSDDKLEGIEKRYIF
jgi:hypothetical protein